MLTNVLICVKIKARGKDEKRIKEGC